jgi:glycosidase
MIYYGDEIGMTGAGDPDNRRMMRFGDDVSSAEAKVREHFSKLAHARRAHPSLYLGSRRTLVADANRYAYVRAYADDRALVLFNRSEQWVTFELELNPEITNGELLDVLSHTRISVRDGSATVSVSPMSSAVYTNSQELHAN